MRQMSKKDEKKTQVGKKKWYDNILTFLLSVFFRENVTVKIRQAIVVVNVLLNITLDALKLEENDLNTDRNTTTVVFTNVSSQVGFPNDNDS